MDRRATAPMEGKASPRKPSVEMASRSSVGSLDVAWRSTAKRAAIERPHSFHKIRGRYITEVAKVQPAAAQDAARHQDPATTAMYIKLAAGEIRDAVRQANARRPARTKLKVVK